MGEFDKRKTVWSIAGSDCSGLAGQVADNRAIDALGVHACSITTAVTAQNGYGLIALNPLTAEQIQSQFDALKDDLPASAIKIGLMPTLESIDVIAEYIKNYHGFVVLDPVMVSSSGKLLMEKNAQAKVNNLFPALSLLTPNIPEAEVLSGIKIQSKSDVEKAAKVLLSQNLKAVYIKGGHAGNQEYIEDYFATDEQNFWLRSKKIKSDNTRGTGCVLAASIAAAIVLDYSLADAVVIGKMQINQAIDKGYSLVTEKNCKGPLKPLSLANEQHYFPELFHSKSCEPFEFPDVGENSLGLYPVVDSAQWLEKLLPLGISTIQLRVKHLSEKDVDKEIKQAVKIAEKYDARLFINDYWELAIKHKAYGVHLGQEDLASADLKAISDAGLRLGVSTHCYYEVARAHAIKPSYLACGPVYHTDSKEMPWIPHGIENLNYWITTLSEYPWVAIGGINLERIRPVAETGVSGIAMISAITQANEPEKVAEAMMALIADSRPANPPSA